MMMISSIVDDLNKKPLKADEQMNILATSQGTVSAAHAAIEMVTNPTKYGLPKDFTIDNLVLAGSPIDVKSELYQKLLYLSSEEGGNKIKNIHYGEYQADGDVVTGLAGTSRLGALNRGFGYVGKIFQAIGQTIFNRPLTDPHIKAAENKPIDPNSVCESFGDELQEKLESDEIH